MKIANIELTKERIIILALAGSAALALLVYFAVYGPLIRQLNSKNAECKAIESGVLYARHIIESSDKAGGARMLIAEKDVSLAINELTNYGKNIGVNFVSILPKEKAPGKDARYNVFPIEMEIEAPDEEFSIFLGSLDIIEKALIKVKSFDITPDPADRMRVKAKVVVDMYLSGE